MTSKTIKLTFAILSISWYSDSLSIYLRLQLWLIGRIMSLSRARKHNCSSCCDYCHSDLAGMIGISCDFAWMIMALVLRFFGLIAWNLAVTAGWDLQLLLPWLLLELLLPWLLWGLCLLSELLLSWLLSEVSLAHATWLKKFYYKKKKKHT